MDEHERLWLELVRYYRHSAVGQRCTGIVHNFNTPLQVLSLYCELLQRKDDEEKNKLAKRLTPELQADWEQYYQYRQDKTRQLLDEIRKLQQLAQLIIQQGVHEDERGRQSFDLNAILRDELELYEANRFFKHMVDKRYYFDQDLPPIAGYYIDFSQSFRLLVDNALEAMELVQLRVLTVETAWQERHRIIRIGDTGVGMAPEVQSRLFEPFFTTKDSPERPHAGLGLYMARRLLNPYGGEIKIQSQPGETWVTVVLPLG
ncbi:MAG: hypothetical protein DRG58_07735 [Deltaproteobacteria bacterium]|nr:MAG: hypothetical protein DRG58_07735 [Deltaproteobacteria bacterium]